MVKITNGVDVFEVTRGAFEGIYSHQGYIVCDVESSSAADTQQVDDDPEEDERTDDEKFVDELEEKPLSNWNKSEVKRYATLMDIDISGTKNINEAKAIVREFMKSRQEEE